MHKKYGSLVDGWCSKIVIRPYGGSLWKYMKGWDAFSSFVTIKVGEGSQTRFWHDIWCGDCPLKESFLELFCIARDRVGLL